MKSKTIDLYFFSGTGNTLLVAREMKKYFEENGFTVNLLRIEKSRNAEINTLHTIGIAVPIAAQTTFPFCWSFINNLPETEDKTEVFLVTTRAMCSGGIIGPAKKILKKKGYVTIGAKEIRMPSNFTPKKMIKLDNNEKKTSAGLIEARRFAHDLHYNITHWLETNPLSGIVKRISLQKSFSWMRKHHTMFVNEGKCIRCGLCFKLCPVDNIEMIDYPEFKDACQFCMRCYDFCPTDAIEMKNMQIRKYTAVQAEELLK